MTTQTTNLDLTMPSANFLVAWVEALSPAESFECWSQGQAGKWCVFLDTAEVDSAWQRVKEAVMRGMLPAAKVSTALAAVAHEGRHVICVYNSDWRDAASIRAAREVLRTLGFTDDLGYKRDIETARGVYGGPDEWYLRD
jgi:hypothetical protein